MNNELKRMETYRVAALTWSVGGVVAALFIAMIGFKLGALFTMAGVIVLLVGITVGSKKSAKFKHEFKDYFLRSAFEEGFQSEVRIDWEGMDLGKIEEAFVIPYGNSNRSDDLVTFKYKGVQVQRTDVCTQRVVSNGKITTTTQLFNGQYMVFSFPKKISQFTVIRENKWFDSKPGGLFSGCPRNEKIDMESVQFNKEFSVFTSDSHEAYYLLTPQFMEILMDFKKTYDEEVFFGFMDDEFHVAINSNMNLFEPSILTPVHKVDRTIYANDIHHIKQVVQQLNLVTDSNE